MKKIGLILFFILVLAGCSINFDKEITSKECEKKGGKIANINSNGQSCTATQKNLGRVSDIKCICDCCK